MWIVVGLGNPGVEYATSRHNAGFMALDRLAARWHVALSDQPLARIGHGTVAGQRVLLVQPQTYMNHSGDGVQRLAPAEDDVLVVIHDDLDLPLGRLRVRRGGGSGGHRGVASIAERFGEDFIRIRIGIGRPPAGMSAADYVLVPLAAEEQGPLTTAVERACEAIECVITQGAAAAMNHFNSGPAPIETCKE